MTTTIHRQIGRLGKRSADDASVAMLMKEVTDTDTLLGKLAEHTKVWRDSWASILVNSTRFADSFHDCYSTIPRTGDTAIPPPETDVSIMKRVALLHSTQNDLKADMMEEVDKIERLIIGPLLECKGALKPVKKAMEKREHKKLDFERFNKQVEHAKKKAVKSDREYSVQSRAEVDLEKATNAYEAADNHLKDIIPPLIDRIVGFLPLVVEIYAEIQHTLCQHSYSALIGYAQDHGYEMEDGPAVIAAWEANFLPVQRDVESEIRIIAKGKAVTLPMNYVPPDRSIIPKVNLPGRAKKPPPPPPPGARGSSPSGSRDDNERPSTGRSKPPSFRDSFEQDEPPVPGQRPTIRSIRSRASQSTLQSERDESPPPPLPGPRPQLRPASSSTADDSASFRGRSSFSSYGGTGGGGVTATPLAGLTPSALASNAGKPEVKRIGSSFSSEKSANLYSYPNGAANGTPDEPEETMSVAARIRSISSNSTPALNDSRPPPPYSATARSPSQGSTFSVAGKKKPPPPPPKKKSLGSNDIWVQALFTFEGQDAGDLSFREGDRIKVTKKTPSIDDWWEGELDGRKGSFPANYCEPTT